MIDKEFEKIITFINKHHVMSLATYSKGTLSVCNLFYVYIGTKNCFVVASDDKTRHIQDILQNPSVAGSIVLETDIVGKIEGLQFRGSFGSLEDVHLKEFYFKRFPYALAMRPKLWRIDVEYFKLTDNRLGFGKKIIWESKNCIR